jgi:hypothetical protein
MLMLADAGQEVGGKLYILGGGWSVTGPAPSPHAIILKVDIPWTDANTRHHFRLALRNEDGEPVFVPGPEGEQPLMLEGDFEAGRPAGLPPGTDLDFSLVANVPPLPLPPGQRFEWRLWIDDETEDDWNRTFLTRDNPAGDQPQG